MPPALLKSGAFTRQLSDAHIMERDCEIETSSGPVHVAVLRVFSTRQHVQYSSQGRHCATFDPRVGGAVVRTLIDTGANVHCMSLAFANQCGLQITREACSTIQGIGGDVRPVGTTIAPVKFGKYTIRLKFLVMTNSVSGYECLLGEGFLCDSFAELKFSPTEVRLKLGNEESQGTELTRRFDRLSTAAETHLVGANPAVATATNDRSAPAAVSRAERRAIFRDIRAGRQVAFQVFVHIEPIVAPLDKAAKDKALAPEILCVVNKHSKPGGTLCGTIPNNTQAKGYKCTLRVDPASHPIAMKQYRLTPLEKAELLKQVDAFIEKGWIEPSISPWSSSVLFIPKPNNKLRFCVDYRQLNARTLGDQNGIPNQGELLDSLGGSNVFSALDLASGYYQLGMDEDSRPYTAFPTPYGLYQWKVMPMGLKTAPAIFQLAMNQILREQIKDGFCLVYLDDIIIKSPDISTHSRHLDSVLSALHEHRLFCQLPKCVWAQSELKYLGHLVSGTGLKPDPAKVEALHHWLPPLDIADQMRTCSVAQRVALRTKIANVCRKFLGFMNYFNRFIPRYSDMAAVLHEQTSDNAPHWTTACTKSWTDLKTVLRNATMMFHPDFARSFHVYSDASIYAIGGVLQQETVDGVMHPVAFCARKLINAERNYNTTEQEMLAMVYCYRQWRCYLEGVTSLMHTDHEPLTWLATQKSLSRRQAGWMDLMSRYDYKVLYVKGDENVVADALSRRLTLPEPESPDPDPHAEKFYAFSANSWDGPIASGSSRATRDCGTAPLTILTCLRAVRRPAAGDNHCPPSGTGTSVRRGGTQDNDTERTTRIIPPHTGEAEPQREPPGSVLAGGFTRRRQREGEHLSPHASSSLGELALSKRQRSDMYRDSLVSDNVPGAASGGIRRSVRFTGPYPTRHSPVQELPAAGGPLAKGPLSSSLETDIQLRGVVPTSGDLRERSDRDNDVPDPPSLSGYDLTGTDPPASSYDRLYLDLLDRVRTAVMSDATTNTEVKRSALQLRIDDGLLWHGSQLYIPHHKNLRTDLLYWHHDVPWAAHLGVAKTVELVKRQFYWPLMDKDIKEYVLSCNMCQSNKPDRRNRTPPLTPLKAPDNCWHTLGVDLIPDLPPSGEERYNAICVFVCHLSKMVRCVPTHTTLSTKGFAELFMREIFVHYGMPAGIVSDRGKQWRSSFFMEICRICGIFLALSTSHHPQTNGLVERYNEVIEAALRSYVSADHRDWHLFLPFMEFALNSTWNAALQSTPYRMNRISMPRNPLERKLESTGIKESVTHPQTSELTASVGSSKFKSSDRSMLQATVEFERARKCVHEAKIRMKERHDAKVRLDFEPLAQGDKVWLSQKYLSLKHPS